MVAMFCLVLLPNLFGVQCADEDFPYVLDRQWKQLLEAVPPVDGKARGEKLLHSLEESLGVETPLWWRPLVESVGVGPRSAHFIENDEAVEALAKRWDDSGKMPFTGFKTVIGSANEKKLELRDGSRSLVITHEIDWQDTEDSIELGRNGISGLIADDNCFLIPQCPAKGAGGPRALYCFDIDTGRLNWKVDLLRGMRGAYTHLQFGSYTEVTVEDGKVIVWTGSEIAALVQAFSVTDGKPLLRFASNGHRL